MKLKRSLESFLLLVSFSFVTDFLHDADYLLSFVFHYFGFFINSSPSPLAFYFDLPNVFAFQKMLLSLLLSSRSIRHATRAIYVCYINYQLKL